MSQLTDLHRQLRQCQLCADRLEPNPIWQGTEKAPILQISQAPGRKVHETKKPFNDLSGQRLRKDWYQIPDDIFYNPDLFYITSVGHCYPGKAKTGDKKPPRVCFDTWTKKEIDLKQNTKLILVIGKEAADRLFPKSNFTDLIFHDQIYDGIPCYVLPHPSPLNVKWFKDHPEFEECRIKEIRSHIHRILDESLKTA